MTDECILPVENGGSSQEFGYLSNAILANREDSPMKSCKEMISLESGDSSDKKRSKRCRLTTETLLVIMTMSGVLIGIVLGFAIQATKPSNIVIDLIKFPGEILMRMLKMMVIPVVITSIVTGLANLDIRKSSKMGGHAVAYYLTTTASAVILGVILVTVIHPGSPNQNNTYPKPDERNQISTADTYFDLVRNVFPDNIVAACFQLVQTKMIPDAEEQEDAVGNQSVDANISDFKVSRATHSKRLEKVSNPNVLGLIAFFIAFGAMLSSLGEEGKPLSRIFQILNTIFMKIITGVIWYSPVGICSLIAGNVIQLDDLQKLGETVGLYVVTVIVGLVIHGFIVLPLIYFAFTRKNPFALMYGVLQAVLTALGTASSAGTLPVTMRCLENNLGIDRRVTQFVLPIGATMNMDGTALLEGVASITIAQMYNMPLSFGQIITISVTATVASIGAAAIPSAGMVTLILVLTTIGIPTEAVATLWTVDWLLDRLRTSLNVFGDCVGAGIVSHLNREHLKSVECREELRPLQDEQSRKETSSLLHHST